MRRADSLEKTLMLEKEEKRTTEDKMVGWHRWLDRLRVVWTPGVGDRQVGLACWGSWGYKKSDMTEWLNWTELMDGEPSRQQSVWLHWVRCDWRGSTQAHRVGLPGGARGITHLPMQETSEPWVQSLGSKDPFRKAGQHTPVFSLGQSFGQRSLEGSSSQSRKESDVTEATWFICIEKVGWQNIPP